MPIMMVTIMEIVLTAVHTACWKALSARQMEPSCVYAWHWAFPYLGAMWFQGLSQVGCPKTALQKDTINPLCHANYLTFSLGYTPGSSPHFFRGSLYCTLPTVFTAHGWDLGSSLLPSLSPPSKTPAFSARLHKAWSPPIRLLFSFSLLLACFNSILARIVLRPAM